MLVYVSLSPEFQKFTSVDILLQTQNGIFDRKMATSVCYLQTETEIYFPWSAVDIVVSAKVPIYEYFKNDSVPVNTYGKSFFPGKWVSSCE
jgi:hypothetical protein